MKRRKIGLHPLIAAGIKRAAAEREAAVIARPMRKMFDTLAKGEVFEVEGKPAMLMPEIDPALRQSATDWVEIAPAIRGWVDCWKRLKPSLKQDKLCYLADRLEQGKELTPRLVEQARAEFDEAIALIPKMEDRKIGNAVLDTRIAWELERVA